MKPKGKRPSTLGLITLAIFVAVIAALCIWQDIKATIVNDPYKWDGDLQAVRWVSRVQNGADFDGADSGVETSFPADITIPLNDTANWIVLIGALWTGETDTVWSTVKRDIKNPFPILDEILDTLQEFDDWIAQQISIDSVGYWLGYCPTCHSVKGRGGDIDTLHIMKGADSLLHVLYWHIGGVTGNTPDSVTIR